MHPAISVIFFTVTSGAGFGFLILAGLGVPLSDHGIPAFLTAAIGGGLAVAGLLASTFHLGHPERAWRAFSQWRSSWLSREGVCAVLSLLLFGGYVFFWVFHGDRIEVLGWLVAAGALATVFTTSMIYAQLKTVPHWNSWMTPACYLLFSLTSGAALAAAFGKWQGTGPYPVAAILIALITVSWVMKLIWWGRADRATLAAQGSTPGTATGLGATGETRLLERPHSGENYLTREMVHQIGRKHAAKLRWIALLCGGALPILLLIAPLMHQASFIWYALAFIFLMAGLFVERWLFFAEARHAVSLYY